MVHMFGSGGVAIAAVVVAVVVMAVVMAVVAIGGVGFACNVFVKFRVSCFVFVQGPASRMRSTRLCS